MLGLAAQAAPEPAEAPIALLVDLSSGQDLHAREAERRFLPASITKVMTAFLAFEMIEAGQLSPEDTVTVTPEIAKEWSGTGSTMFLKAGETVTIDRLLRGITTVSANDGSMMLAVHASGSVEEWVRLMNAKAREIGMHDSYFGTPNGWPDEGRTFTSARDLAILAEAMISRHKGLYRTYFGHRSFAHGSHTQANHDPITGVLPGADGIKTGYTREAGYNFLGTAERDGRRLVMVVAGTESEAERARISRAYLEWGFSQFEPHPILAAGSFVAQARIQDGAERSVPLLAARDITVSLPHDGSRAIKLTLRYSGPIPAPVSKSDAVAELEISGEGITPYRVPLIAGSAVDRANWWQRIRNGLAGLFA